MRFSTSTLLLAASIQQDVLAGECAPGRSLRNAGAKAATSKRLRLTGLRVLNIIPTPGHKAKVQDQRQPNSKQAARLPVAPVFAGAA